MTASDPLIQALNSLRHNDLVQAESWCRMALASAPERPDAQNALGAIMLRLGRAPEAIEAFRLAVSRAPEVAEYQCNLGEAFRAIARPRDAAAAFIRACTLDPTFAAAHHNLAAALMAAGQADEVWAAMYRRVVAIEPSPPGDTFLGLGIAEHRAGRRENASKAYRKAMATAPGLAAAHSLLGLVLHGRFADLNEVLRRYRAAVILAPEDVALRYNLATALQGEKGSLANALRAYREVIALAPAFAEAHRDYGNMLKARLELEPALAEYGRSLAIRPDYPEVRSNVLVTLPFLDACDPRTVFELHRRHGRSIEARFAGRIPPHTNDRDPERRLRVGYLSPHFREHILMQNLAPVLRCHDRQQVEVHVFAHEPNADATTARMQSLAEHWHFIHGLTDDAAADLVRASRIDILIHPMGHWSDNRIAVLARKPAPLQIAYTFNSPTTGMAAFDYSIADRWLDPDGQLQAFCTERLLYLPGGFLVTEYTTAPAIEPPPRMRQGFPTFGYFGNPQKISPATAALWARTLASTPEARLHVRGPYLDNAEVAATLRKRLDGAGIDGRRVTIVGPIASYAGHLLDHNRIDVMLDTVPFGGGRTSEDALWMGVPVVSIAGDSVHGRNTMNRLLRIGAPELIADTAERFVSIASSLAASPERLATYRQTLRERLLASNLMDFAGHTRELELALRMIWREWCARH